MSEGGAERRIHARVQVFIDVTALSDKGAVKGELADLSKGGARIRFAHPIGKKGDMFTLQLPYPGRSDICVSSEIVRSEAGLVGHMVGVRFNSLSPEDHENLHKLLEVLLNAAGSQSRAHPRIKQRLSIQYGTTSERQAVLEDVSIGGLAIRLPEPMVLDEEIDFELENPKTHQRTVVKGKVMHQRKIETEGEEGYIIGFQYVELDEQQALDVRAIIRAILDLTDQLG